MPVQRRRTPWMASETTIPPISARASTREGSQSDTPHAPSAPGREAMNTPTGRTRLVLVLALLVLGVLGATSSALACVVGTGTSASCTEAALTACLPGGGSFDGTVTFACGGAATITITSQKAISANTTIDGGGVITISGGGTVGLFTMNSGVMFTVENLTIANGNSASFGGGAILNQGPGTLTVTNCTFSGNSAGINGG